MNRYSYEVKIRAKSGGLTFVWGGPDVKKPLLAPLYLICRLDDLSEPVAIRLKTSAADIDYGVLGPSQVVVVPLSDGVYVSAIPTSLKGDGMMSCAIVM